MEAPITTFGSRSGIRNPVAARDIQAEMTSATPYHPTGNGLVEHINKTNKNVLQGLMETVKTDCWDDVLPLCMRVSRATVHTTTSCRPTHLNPGHELRLPIELTLPFDSLSVGYIIVCIQTLQRRLHEAFRLVRKNATRVQVHEKRIRDRQAKGHSCYTKPRPRRDHPLSSIKRGGDSMKSHLQGHRQFT